MANKLFLHFTLGHDRFAVSTDHIAEVIPLVEMTRIPKTEPHICGVFDYRGEMIPIIDTAMLLYDRPHQRKVCTRIIVLNRDGEAANGTIGLIAEKVNKTEIFDTQDFASHTLSNAQTPYLGKILKDNQGEIQLIELEKLVPSEAANLRIAIDHV